MAVEGVVLYIGGGEAQHSAEMLRMQNFFHFRGQEGWLTASSGVASELPTPAAGVLVNPGPFLVNSRFPGGALQSYMGRVITGTMAQTTNVPPGSPRSDLVVMNIQDPYPSDGTQWDYPGAPGSDARRTGPYALIRVIDNVPDKTVALSDLPVGRPEREWTAIPICRLDRPGNTGTVTNDMIIPLRSIINPWAGIQLPDALLSQLDEIEDAVSDIGDAINGIKNQKFPVPAIWTGGGQVATSLTINTVYPGDTDWKQWPAEWGGPVIVPPWANYVSYSSEVLGAQYYTSSSSSGVDANVLFSHRMKLGTSTSPSVNNELVEPNDVYYAACPDKRASRPPITCNIKGAGQFKLNSADIGKKVLGLNQVKRIPGTGSRLYNGVLAAVPGVTTVFGIIQFKEGPV